MKTILITGANGNLGTAVVKALQAEGHQIIALVGRGDTKEIDQLSSVFVYSLDILNEEIVHQFVQEITQKYPELDAVVALVGAFAEGNLLQTHKAMLDKLLNLNFYSLFNVVKPAFEHFVNKNRCGKFIFIGARPALNPEEGKDNFAYSLSKTLVFKTAELINTEGKDKNISASVIVPSTIDTPATRAAFPEADYSRWITPEKIAELIRFILADIGMEKKEHIWL